MFDSFFDSFTLLDWSPGSGAGRRGRRLLAQGEAATATITGIRVTRTGSDGEGSNNYRYVYALDVRAGTTVRRLACRHYLTPDRKLAHVGSQVQVRHRKNRVIIDWEATLSALGRDGSLASSAVSWKPLRPSKAPADGVVDHEQNGPRRRIGQGKPATATVLRVNALTSNLFGSTLENVDVDVLLRFKDGTSREGLLRKIVAPDYAAYLLEVGTVLPVGVDKGGERITVDWLAAVNGGASVEHAPPAATRDVSAPLPPTQSDSIGAAFQGLIGKALDAGGVSAETPEGAEIPFETYVEVSARLAHGAVPADQHDAFAEQFGVAPDAWTAGSQAWQSRLARDWQLGAKYGEAYSAAYQRLG